MSSDNNSNQPKDDFDFSESFTKLEEITEKFEENEFDLDTGINKFEEGVKIANKLKEKLKEAENKVEKIQQDFDDNRE